METRAGMRIGNTLRVRCGVRSLCRQQSFHVRSKKTVNDENEEESIPSLRGELRRLFKLVHPDLFNAHPRAQEINQRSFQLLQEYLNVAKGYSSSQQQSYQFIFYLHNNAGSEKLEKVEVTLPRPQVRCLSPNGAEILPVTRAALGHLLFACGLSRQVRGGLTSEEEQMRLSDLFQQASELQRQNEVSLLGVEQHLVAIKNALCIGRGIRVSFCSALAGVTVREQVELLRRLGKALDVCKDTNLLGHAVLIGDRYGVDNLGNLWLRHEDAAEKWSTFFSSADLGRALKYKREATVRRALELMRIGRSFKVSTVGLQSFSYKEIYAATWGFKEQLGRGAFGTVYKGVLSDGRPIAVKKLDKLLEEGEKEFRTEMSIISTIHHKNLVQLFGFGVKDSQRLLVYEHMANGSLDNALFDNNNFLDWNLRFQIAVGAAKGIAYLHEECRNQIVHCDIKPQNVLLDEAYTPKISDFGLAKLMGINQTRTFTTTRGTRGYLAPEWYKNTAITAKVDVYSFGMMLLEIICCRKSLKPEAGETEVVLSDWVYECFKCGRLRKLVEEQQAEDNEIEGRQLERMVLVGLWCIQDDPSLRPTMKKVVHMLEGTVEIMVPPPPPSFLEEP